MIIIKILLFRAQETDEEMKKRLGKVREHYHNLPQELYEQQKLESNRRQMENYSELRRSNRLETVRANNRLSRMLNPKKEKDAHEKWKQRYKK